MGDSLTGMGGIGDSMGGMGDSSMGGNGEMGDSSMGGSGGMGDSSMGGNGGMGDSSMGGMGDGDMEDMQDEMYEYMDKFRNEFLECISEDEFLFSKCGMGDYCHPEDCDEPMSLPTGKCLMSGDRIKCSMENGKWMITQQECEPEMCEAAEMMMMKVEMMYHELEDQEREMDDKERELDDKERELDEVRDALETETEVLSGIIEEKEKALGDKEKALEDAEDRRKDDEEFIESLEDKLMEGREIFEKLPAGAHWQNSEWVPKDCPVECGLPESTRTRSHWCAYNDENIEGMAPEWYCEIVDSENTPGPNADLRKCDATPACCYPSVCDADQKNQDTNDDGCKDDGCKCKIKTVKLTPLQSTTTEMDVMIHANATLRAWHQKLETSKTKKTHAQWVANVLIWDADQISKKKTPTETVVLMNASK
eukprot:UN29734